MTEKTTAQSLKVTARELSGKKVKNLRLEGLVPGVIYGHKKESRSLVVPEKEFSKLLEAVGQSSLVNLEIDDQKPIKVLIHDVQLHPVKKHVLHVDFYQVNLKEKLRTMIPLEIVGTSDAVEIEGGTLMIIKDEVEVECLPEDLLPHIEVDVTTLKSLEDIVHVSDLVVPSSLHILDDPEEVLISIAAPRSQAELDELEAPVADDTASVESETKSGTDNAPEAAA